VGPDCDALPESRCPCREGFLAPKVSGKYQVGGIGMNAFEITLDGKPIARVNNIHERNYDYKEVELEAGKLYPITAEFHEVFQ
jgi:hypothetical protein